jgi:diketogulonate reductase-like aldo/keto reductase
MILMSDGELAKALANECFELSDGTRIPMLGLGTYRLIGPVGERVVRQALEIGYRHIDTAMYYGNQAEIGWAIRGYPREELYLVSKLWPGDQTKERVPLACRQILRELKTDYIDLLLIHWPDRSVPFEETLEAMDQLRQAGKVRSIGVSNFTIRHIKDLLPVGIQLVTNQVELHPYLNQRELQTFCAEHGIRLTGFSPLARGEIFADEQLQSIGDKYGKTPGQIVLRWAIQNGVIVIPKTTNPARLVENATIFDFTLSTEDLAAVDAFNEDRRLANPDVANFDYV